MLILYPSPYLLLSLDGERLDYFDIRGFAIALDLDERVDVRLKLIDLRERVVNRTPPVLGMKVVQVLQNNPFAVYDTPALALSLLP